MHTFVIARGDQMRVFVYKLKVRHNDHKMRVVHRLCDTWLSDRYRLSLKISVPLGVSVCVGESVDLRV